MAVRNYAIAFQVAAAFRGNSAFVDAATKLRGLKDEERQQKRELANLNQEYKNAAIGLNEFIRRQQELGQRIAQTSKDMKAQKAISQAQGQFENSFGNMTRYGANALQFAEMTKGVMSLANVATDFQAKMSKVQAITGSTNDEFDKLEAEALRLGKTTRYSASEAADAMTYLGMAGWKAESIIAGMPGLLSLAAASGTDLALTADIVSDDLTAFGLKADQAGRMADVFAKIVTSTNTTVAMLGETMKYAAPVAHGFGASLEETSALAGLMANAGIKASNAGTALRAGFLRLAAPTAKAGKALAEMGMDLSDAAREHQEAAAALDALGIKMKDEHNEAKSVAQIVRELSVAMTGLSDAEKLAKMQAIFGTTAASGWLAVINQGPEALEKLIKSLEASKGTAQEMADVMQNNARGKIIAMKSAIESLQISLGNTLLPSLAMAAQGAAELASAMATFASDNSGLTATVLNSALAVTALGAAGNGLMWIYSGLRVVYTGVTAALVWYRNTAILATAATYAQAAGMKIVTAAQWLFNAAMAANPVGAFIIAMVALCGVLRYVYDNFEEIKVVWDRFWQAVENGCPPLAMAFKGLWLSLTLPYQIMCALVDKAREFFGLKTSVDKAAELRGAEENMGDIPSNAAGGIYGKGAFLTTFAEEGPEAAIPLDGSPRAVGLWQRAGELLGQRSSRGGEYNISIPITVNGGADSSTVQNIGAQVEAAVRRALANIEHENRRVSFA